MRRAIDLLARCRRGAVAPTVALSLIALIAAGGIAFDYAHVAGMATELQSAADQAALAGATQLDGQTGAIARATAAAQSLITNNTLLASDAGADATAPRKATVATITFYDGWNQTNDTPGTVTTSDSAARVVEITIAGRTATYALTPVVSALSSGAIDAKAVASVGRAICKTPPVMICNPDEPSGNTNEKLPFTAARGIGLSLVTGSASVPGNFGWLDSGNGPGAGALAGELGYNQPIGNCQNYDGVTTKTGMDAAVLKAFNTRFDVYANGNTTCPNNPGGVCSPSTNTRKDLVCKPNNSNTACTNDNWNESSNPYRLPASGGALKTGDTYPNIMGYPHDMVQAGLMSSWAAAYAIKGDGNWDRDAYFKVNYGYDSAGWKTATSLTASASRFDVYRWELGNTLSNAKGISVPQINGNEGAFGQPATGRTGLAQTGTQPDRREMAVAVLNCQALTAHGKFSAQPVSWLDVFLTEPAMKRGSGTNLYTSDKGIYVEVVGVTQASPSDPSAVVIRHDKPFLIK